MRQVKTNILRYYLKWILWVLLAQIILVNVSASIYAYKFTHFYNPPAPSIPSQNVFNKTWKLFVGPKFYKNTNEPEPSFDYETIRLKTIEGIPIDAWYSKADSSNACVILLHGYSGNKSFVQNEAAMFRRWGYSVLLFDLRGHGRSGTNTTTFGAKETDELEKAYEFARQKGNSKIILYGVSLGAAICIKEVAEGNIHPAAVIADMPFESLHRHFKARARILGFPSEPFALLTTFWLGIEKGYNGFQIDISSYAKKVNCPVLMEWGEKDRYVTRSETENVFNNIASKNKKLVTYPYADHESFLEKDPMTWEKEIQAFIKSVQ
jgi:alpha-beta hydrolase superfamily lysophospholipase